LSNIGVSFKFKAQIAGKYVFLQKAGHMTRNRRTETVIYAGIWLVVAAVYLLDVMRGRSNSADVPLLDGTVVARMLTTLLPFVALFLVNNCVLIPRLLLNNRYKTYFLCTLAVAAAVWYFQYVRFMDDMTFILQHDPQALHRGPQPLFPFPLLLDSTYDILIVGVNIAVALMFQRYEDKLERESLMKANAESQLSYLKAQINPHFYMNMLNNIHGMIDIDKAKAQEMVLGMSRLMRYMLYESPQPMIALSAETGFLQNYISIMRQRFPEDKVRISASFPDETEMAGVRIAPLLFLVFIENAFKHGVSYCDESFVAVSLAVNGHMVEFNCMNSVHADREKHPEGIGLHNAEQRMALIYGSNFSLNINNDESIYSVRLTVPVHENKDTDNRR